MLAFGVKTEKPLTLHTVTANYCSAAGKAGGGVYMASSNFDAGQLFAATSKNQAPVGQDVGFEAHDIKVCCSQGFRESHSLILTFSHSLTVYNPLPRSPLIP